MNGVTSNRGRPRQALPRIDESYERALLGGQNNPGRLVPLAQGGRGTTVTIHGINGAPTDVQALSEQAAGEGHNVQTFVYDDNFRRLTDSSQDLAGELREWMRANPGQPLRIQAHSMGGRVALGALARLQEEGQLRNPVELDLIAPPLGGFGGANAARMDFLDVIGRVAPNVRPGRDMGSDSDFQQQLERLQLPGVRTRIITGREDTVVDAQLPGFRAIARNLAAQQLQLPGDHSTVIDQVR